VTIEKSIHQSKLRLHVTKIRDNTKKFTRMPSSDFEFLINLICSKNCEEGYHIYRSAVPAEERLAVTVRFFVTGDSYTNLQYPFEISKQAIDYIILEAHSFRSVVQSIVFSELTVILEMCRNSEHRFSFVQFYVC
jgi:hypothetical protein